MDISSIGQKIKQLRNEKGWSQDELARQAGVPFTTVTKIETGVIKNPSIEKMAKIAKALDVTVDILISVNDNNE